MTLGGAVDINKMNNFSRAALSSFYCSGNVMGHTYTDQSLRSNVEILNINRILQFNRPIKAIPQAWVNKKT